jgi:hypothetical protein
MLIGRSSIQIGELETLPLFYSTMEVLFLSSKQRLLVRRDGVGSNIMGVPYTSMRTLSRWMNYFRVCARICCPRVVMSLTPHEGNSVQANPAPEAAIRDFFVKYGPSARDCYNSTSSGDHLQAHESQLLTTIDEMQWDEIDRLVSKEVFNAKLDEATPFRVVLILPADEKRLTGHATVITRTVLRLLWKARGTQLKRKAKELFHVFKPNRESGSSAGWLFESLVHDMLEAGINAPIDPMEADLNFRSDAVNDKYLTCTVGTVRWQSSTMEYVPYTQNDRTLELESNHYYVPVDAKHPTYDSFTFEMVPCSSYTGPILNTDDKTIYEKKDVSAVSIMVTRLIIFLLRCCWSII